MKAQYFLSLTMVGLLLVVAPHGLRADGDSAGWVQAKSPQYRRAVEAIKKKDFEKAIELLKKTVGKNGKDADAFNLLGFSYRNLRNFDAAFANYRTALKIDPDHLGAHEYIGEAYLKVGNPAKAKEHLGRLDALCFFGCSEYTDLKRAIRAYEEKN